MKKIIFIIFLLMITKRIYALENFYIGEKVTDMYIEQYDDKNFHNGAPHVLKNSNDEIVYCITPYKSLKTGGIYETYSYNEYKLNLDYGILEKINLIAHFGYNYKDHTDIKWYGITQFLIWKTLNPQDIYFTDTYNGNRIDKYSEEIKEIENLINNYYIIPSFGDDYYSYTTNKKYEMIDLNNVLKEYELYESTLDMEINNNILYIDTKNPGVHQIRFIKRERNDNDYILYISNDSQSLILPGRFTYPGFTLTIEVGNGNITINKTNPDTNFNKSIYGLYDSNNKLIEEINTNELGIGYIEDLPYDKYYIREIEPGTGYLLDTKTYEVNIDECNRNIVINSYEEKIIGDLIINKYYNENSEYKLENNAIFDIYDSTGNLITSNKTVNGIIKTKLNYGNYNIVQKSGMTNYNLVDNFNVLIDAKKEYLYNLYSEKKEYKESDLPDLYSHKKEYKESKLYDIEDNYIIVDVPDTKKISLNIKISLSLIIIGLFLIFLSKIKTTNYY